MALIGRVLAAALVAASLASLIGAISEHETERARWSRERDAVGTDRYDAQASDRAYARSRDARALAGASAMFLVIGAWWILAMGAPSTTPGSRTATTFRRHGSALFDLLIVGAISALSLLDDGESAWLHAMTASAPLVALATHAASLQLLGQTAGMRLFGLRAREVGPGRALVASIALPLAIVGLLRAAWSAPHWRLAGVAPGRDAE